MTASTGIQPTIWIVAQFRRLHPGRHATAPLRLRQSTSRTIFPNAWYYDDPTTPKKIILCPSTCTATNAATGAKLQALVGCKGELPK